MLTWTLSTEPLASRMYPEFCHRSTSSRAFHHGSNTGTSNNNFNGWTTAAHKHTNQNTKVLPKPHARIQGSTWVRFLSMVCANTALCTFEPHHQMKFHMPNASNMMLRSSLCITSCPLIGNVGTLS
eukprot:5748364-Amphidinium_carterae.1